MSILSFKNELDLAIFFLNENFPTLKLKVEIWNFELFQVRYWLNYQIEMPLK